MRLDLRSSVLILLTLFFHQGLGQNFGSYINITSTSNPFALSCNNNVKDRIILTDPCGVIESPCFPMNYPEEIPNGFKIYDLDANNGTTVLAYQFTIIVFETNPVGGYLDFNPTISYDPGTDTNRFIPGERFLTLSGSASTSPGVLLDFENQDNQRRMVNGTFVLNGTNFFLNFYSTRVENDTGVQLNYCADYDLCELNDVICSSSTTGTCVRNGFQSYSCVCNTGYTGSSCIDIDECLSSPCDSNAQCTNTPGSFTCTCNNGYSGNGLTCGDIDECTMDTDNCDTNAMCTNTIGSFTCACNTGYSGDGVTCAEIMACSSNPCDSNATCANTGAGTFTCTCNTGYTGDGTTCSDVDECTPNNPCDSNAACQNTPGNFTCTCNDGYTGDGTTCTDVDECSQTPSVCDANAACMNTIGNFTCTCNTGFTGNGLSCSEINECSSTTTNNCSVNAQCMDLTPGFSCTCNGGYTGDGVNCTNIDECTMGTNNCSSNAMCTDTLGGFTCTCDTGFTGNGVTCADIDECALNMDNCGQNAMCNNTIGSFTCVCNPGYTGDGLTCTDIDECAINTDDCAASATCINTMGSFTCGCNSGYTGDGVICTNIDECATNTDNCSLNAMCNDTEGSFTCTCDGGYTGDGVTCTDIDECALNMDNCGQNAMCNNTIGSFNCTCIAGYTGDGITCIDIDECMTNTDNCSPNAMCMDTEGSFTCTCNTGYTGNGVTCTDIDECALNMDNCSQNAMCGNTIGSFTCVCNPGYTGDGVMCINIDECMTNTDNCSSNATCMDTEGSFTCTCNAGYTGNGVTCTDIDECSSNALNNCSANGECMNTVPGFSCSCNSGFTGDGVTCMDIDECADSMLNNCTSPEEVCNNTVGSFECNCNSPSYRGMSPNCRGFYCPGFQNGVVSNCTIPGFLEWPTFFDGSLLYDNAITVRWFVNLTGQSVFPAIRFTFLNLSVQSPQDYIIFGNSSDPEQMFTYAIFTGNETNVVNNQFPASETNPENYNPNNRSYIPLIGGTEIYVIFITDRRVQDLGFVIQYEADQDDCPSPSPCQNGGMCMDGAFTYTCVNCPGFTGQNCDVDIDECTNGDNNCDMNANCINTPGSFNCMCNQGFTGNGTSCQPFLEVGNLVVTPMSNETSSSFSIYFNGTSPWFNNPNYVTNYFIMITEIVMGNTIDITTLSVDAPNFLPINVPVTPGVLYEVQIIQQSTGSEFSNTIFQFALNEDRMNATSASIAPLPPTGLMVNFTTDFSANLVWTAPNETNIGATTQYEVSYRRTQQNCDTFAIIELNVTDCSETLIRFPVNGQSYTLDGLQRYRNYEIRIRAYTSFGPGPWSNTVQPFIGTICGSNGNAASAIANPCNFSKAAIMSNNFPGIYSSQSEEYWQINFQEGIQFVADYVNIQDAQDFVDFGPGPVPAIRPAENAVNNLNNDMFVMVNGSRERGTILASFEQNTVNNGQIYSIFSSDRFQNSFGFLIYYQTNSSGCDDSPCQNGGTCTVIPFNFTCSCPAQWGGETCNRPNVNFVSSSCVGTSSSAVTITWSVTSQWADNPTIIGGYNVAAMPTPASLPIGTTSYDASGFSPYELVTVTLSVNLNNPDVETSPSTFTCRTLEAPAGAPGSVTASSPNSTSISVSWTTPTSANGVISGYRIDYTQTDASQFGEIADVGDDNVGMVMTTMLNNLRPFRTYSVTVAAINGAGLGEIGSATAQTQEGVPVGPVQNLMATPSASSVSLMFMQPETITGNLQYAVSYMPGSGSASGTTSPIAISNLTPATSYTFTVTPSTGAGNGAASTVASITVTTLEDIPGQVSNLMLNPDSSTSIVATWSLPIQPNGVITQYRISWVPSSGGTAMSMIVTNPPLTISSLSVYTMYTVSVSAFTAIGEGMNMSAMARTLAGAPQGPVQDVTTMIGQSTINLTITEPAIVTGPFTYEIRYMLASGGGMMMAPSVDSPFSITGLLSGQTYTIMVFPISNNAVGSSPFTINVTTEGGPPGPVTNLQGGNIMPTSVELTWNPPIGSIVPLTNYLISWTPSTGTGMEITGNVSSFSVINLNPATTYNFTVSAINSLGTGQSVTLTNIQTENAPTPGPVTNLVLMTNGGTTNVSWDAPSSIVPVAYTVTAVPLGSGDTIIVTGLQATSTSFPNLNEDQGYTITVTPTVQSGSGTPLTVEQPRVPVPVNDTIPEASTAQNPNLQGASPTNAFNIRNPCMYADQLFQSQRGFVTSIQIIVKQQTASESQDPSVWSICSEVTPSCPYVTGQVVCTPPSSRKKRSLTADQEEYTIGLDTSCSTSDSGVCNGPLRPATAYDVAFRGMNLEGTSNTTAYGALTTTAAATGLQPGEIAAIVICSVILLIIIILTIVFLVRRSRTRQSRTISHPKVEETYSTVKRKPETTRYESSPQTAAYSTEEENKTKM